jgi:HSP20 family protein
LRTQLFHISRTRPERQKILASNDRRLNLPMPLLGPAVALGSAAVRSSDMRARVHSVTLPSEVAEFADELRRLFLDLGRALGPESLTGECSPALDVYESDDSIEIVIDLPGVESGAVRVAVKGDTVLIVGEKAARRPRPESSFHLVERGFGRFARTVRLGRACDMTRIRARLADGELRVSLPKIADRRGRTIPIAIG